MTTLIERLKYKSMEAKLAGDFGKYTVMQISANDIAKILAMVEAAENFTDAYRNQPENKMRGIDRLPEHYDALEKAFGELDQ